jgi:DNA polymerase I-like protein with 3'-5' exonuclease and polymerase domains
MYGMGKEKFEKQTEGIPMEKIDNTFRSLRKYRNDIRQFLNANGYVETVYGRRRHLTREENYKGVNSIIQGSAADIMKYSIVNLSDSLRDKMRLTVHDELIFEDLNKDEVEEIKTVMTSCNPLLRVSSGKGKNWWEASKKDDTVSVSTMIMEDSEDMVEAGVS